MKKIWLIVLAVTGLLILACCWFRRPGRSDGHPGWGRHDHAGSRNVRSIPVTAVCGKAHI